MDNIPSNNEITGDEEGTPSLVDRAREMLTLIGDVSRADEDRMDTIEYIKLSIDGFWKLADIVEYGTAADLREFADDLEASK